MDLIKFIKSLEELLYEVATWLLFYPRTLWRALIRPASLAQYTESELAERVEDQFTDVVSPPMFLLLTLLLAHGLELITHRPAEEHFSVLGSKILESDANLLIFRSVAYCVFPVLMARALLRRLHVAIDRDSLRRPFYAQCFIVAPFVIMNSIGVLLAQSAIPFANGVSSGVGALSAIWYLVVEAQWFARRLGIGVASGAGIAIVNFAGAVVLVIAVAALVLMPDAAGATAG